MSLAWTISGIILNEDTFQLVEKSFCRNIKAIWILHKTLSKKMLNSCQSLKNKLEERKKDELLLHENRNL